MYNVCGILSSLENEPAFKIGRYAPEMLKYIDECMELHQKNTHRVFPGMRSKYRVAIIREGLNGVMAAGFEPWDVHMCDLLSGRITLEGFRGIVFVCGFS